MSLRMEEALSTDFSSLRAARAARLRPTHPGTVLRHDFMMPLNLSARALALALRVPPNRIAALVNGTRAVSADTALRLARYFGTTAQFWLNLQTHHDLCVARDKLERRIAREVQVRCAT